jgi:hypothetical protein
VDARHKAGHDEMKVTAYIPSGPRWIATTPVREISTSPSGSVQAALAT